MPKKLSILRKMADLLDDGKSSWENFKLFSSDRISSRVMETFIYASKKSMLRPLLSLFMVPNVGFLLKNDTANYVLQAFFTHCTSKSLSLDLFNAISSQLLQKGLEPRRIGLLYKIVKSELIPTSLTHPFLVNSIKNSFRLNPDGADNCALALLSSNVPTTRRGPSRHFEAKEFHPIGCAILIHLFSSHPTTDSQILLDQFIEIPISILFRLGMDASGSRVLETVFSSPVIGKKKSERLFKKLFAASLAETEQCSMAKWAENTFGSRVVEAIFLSVPLDQKLILAQYLSDYIKELRKPRSKGQYVIKSCMLDEFILSKSNWIKILAERKKKACASNKLT